MFNDWRRGVEKGHDTGLLKTIAGQFGQVALADGSRIFNYDGDRAGRITWKLVRGIYSLELGKFLLEDLPKELILPDVRVHPQLDEKIPWWPYVRATKALGTHGGVFDYKWLCVTLDGARLHAIAIALWDRLLVFARLHDPTCSCRACVERKSATEQEAQGLTTLKS